MTIDSHPQKKPNKSINQEVKTIDGVGNVNNNNNNSSSNNNNICSNKEKTKKT